MPEGYAPLMVYGTLVVAIGLASLGLSIVIPRLLGTRRSNAVKLEAYECGVPSLTEGARGRFSVRFYLVAILFILFDVEVVFLLPWAAEHKRLGMGVTLAVLTFLALIVLGYIYEWKRGGLEWE